MVNKTSTEECPWYVVPSDEKWYQRYVVSEIVLDTLRQANPKFPESVVSEENLTFYLNQLKDGLN